MRTRITILLFLAFAVAAGSASVMAQCTTCESEPAGDNPFEFHQLAFNPYTLGLEAGTQAPSIEGVSYDGAATVLVVIRETLNASYCDLLALWADLPNVQLIVSASALPSSTRSALVSSLEGRCTLLFDPVAAIVAGSFLVGDRASPVTFLIDAAGVITYRWRGFSFSNVMRYDRAVRSLADEGSVAADILTQSIYWTGESVDWPEFPLYSPSGDPVYLGSGSPYLIYFGTHVGPKGEAIIRDLNPLRELFPSINFVMLYEYLSEDARRASWEAGQLLGYDESQPDRYGVPFEEYLASSTDYLESILSTLDATPTDWTVLIDKDRDLIYSWTLFGAPSVLILDAAGRVVLPCSIYPVWQDETGYWVTEGTQAYLADLLEQVVAP